MSNNQEPLLPSVDAILKKSEIPDRHTFFQIKNFIIGKEYTVQGQLWQIIRELKSRRENIEALELQIAEGQDNVELINVKIKRIECGLLVAKEDLDKQELDITKRKLEREKYSLSKNIEKLQDKLKYILEEVLYFKNAFEILNKVEPIKPIDDIEAQKQYWNEKLHTHLNLTLLLNHHLDVDFVNTIMALDDDAPVKKHMSVILEKVQQRMLAERDRQKAEAAEVYYKKLPQKENDG